MFAFGNLPSMSHMVLFAAEPSTWGWILILAAVFVVSRVFRSSRRVRASGTTARRRFPWKTAIVVAMVVLYFKSGRHDNGPRFAWDWDNDRPRVDPLHPGGGGFPAIRAKDLWALRGAAGVADGVEAEDPSDDEGTTAESIDATQARDRAVSASKRKAPAPPAPPRVRQLSTKRAAKDDQPHATADVGRTVTEARQLAARVIAETKAIYGKTMRDTAALTVFGGKGTKRGDGSKASAAVTAEANEAAPSPVAAPSAPNPPAERAPALAAAPSAPAPSEPPIAPLPAAEREPTAGSAEAASPSGGKAPWWLNEPPGRDRDTYYTKVKVGPYTDVSQCEEELPNELVRATNVYIDSYLGAGASKILHIPPAFIHDTIVKELYEEPYEASVSPMVYLHARLAFDRRTRAQFQRMYRDAQIENRLLEVAGGAGAVLLLLGTVFGYLKLDTLTRGYYTRRLQFAAAAVILTTVVVGTKIAMSTNTARTAGSESVPNVVSEARNQYLP